MTTKLPNGLSVEEREYAAAEVVELVLEATAAELSGCLNSLQERREQATVETEPQTFLDGLHAAARALRQRAQDLGIPHLVENQATAPIEVGRPGEKDS